jgi:hypothetical protein
MKIFTRPILGRVLAVGVTLVVGLSTVVFEATAQQQKSIAVGARVRTITALSVRPIPSITSSRLGRQAPSSQGTVLEGPVVADGFSWYKVDYDTGPDGWSAGSYLRDLTVGGGEEARPLGLTPTSLSFSYAIGSGMPAAKKLLVTNLTPAVLPWTASDDATWLGVSPNEGNQSAELSVTVMPDGMVPGTYHGRITVAPSALPYGARMVPVSLVITSPPVSAPRIIAHPKNLVRDSGESASFSVEANSVRPLSYQWQMGRSTSFAFSDIPGATQSTYTISNVALDHDGFQYRVIVSNSLGSVTSLPATLSVRERWAAGAYVRTTAVLNIRSTPSITSSRLGRQPVGSQGTVLEGPVVADGFSWYKVDYDTGPDGWSAGSYLTRVSR